MNTNLPSDKKQSRAHSLVGASANPDDRPEDDFYPSPPPVTLGLLKVENFVGGIWEPACGDGAMSKVLQKAGHVVYSTDKNPRGFGTQLNFLESMKLYAPNIVTNPPFKLMQEFAEHALTWLQCEKLCLFGKLAFLETQERTLWLETTPLKYAYVFRKRLSLYRNGNGEQYGENTGMIAFAWYVWERGYEGEPVIRWI